MYVWFIRVHPYVHMQHGHKIIVHLRIFISFFFFLSFVNSILIFFFFIFYSFTFFFLLLFHFNLFRFRKRRSKSVVRDLTKESELSPVCTKGCKSITTSRNVSKSFSWNQWSIIVDIYRWDFFFFQVYFERITSRRFFLIKKFMFTFDSPYVYTCARSG